MAATVVPCKYKTGRVLGEGTYATVREAVHIESGKRYAVKVISKKLMQGKENMIRNEIAVLGQISVGHANILTLTDYFETLNNLYLVTELAEGGELFDRICRKGSYYEHDAAQLVRTICQGVAYLHSKEIVHRDLKPENLLFKTEAEDSELLIADFGLSKIIDKEKFDLLTTTCGTPGYMAPEILQRSGHGKPVDMWAIGVITFFLLSGYTPFDRQNTVDEMHAIIKSEYSFEPPEAWDGISDTARAFVRALLIANPNERMTAVQALDHPWLTQYQQKQPAAPTAAATTGMDHYLQHYQYPQNPVQQPTYQHIQRPLPPLPLPQQYSYSTNATANVNGNVNNHEDVSMDMDGVESATMPQHDLLPNMKARMQARRRFRNAIQAVKAANKFRGLQDELMRRPQPEDVSHVLASPPH
ncbi:kinase-like domain-containing protein [Linnemannia elongata]|nr:kinase-like domain-containing protein [Linnemannia elongata]